MKVKALVDCVGIGYELKVGDTAGLSKELAEKLIMFGYVQEVKSPRTKETKVKK
ncbi:hypothetical protein [Cytobacillus firmus]|uniref:hypothetical protein n=1 Tax=Cytobacillus firmus TaxID=1399 RepID=UPI0018CEB86A|nr:hypothetical protein [Cytobacillus firmus]MED1906763.1 hypothetical protein [Cytobacillus firmus]